MTEVEALILISQCISSASIVGVFLGLALVFFTGR